MQFRRTDEGRFDARLRHQRQIADELDRVAEAVVVEHEHAASVSAGARPGGKAGAQRLGERLSGDPARLVAFPSALEVAHQEIETANAADGFSAAEALRLLEG